MQFESRKGISSSFTDADMKAYLENLPEEDTWLVRAKLKLYLSK